MRDWISLGSISIISLKNFSASASRPFCLESSRPNSVRDWIFLGSISIISLKNFSASASRPFCLESSRPNSVRAGSCFGLCFITARNFSSAEEASLCCANQIPHSVYSFATNKSFSISSAKWSKTVLIVKLLSERPFWCLAHKKPKHKFVFPTCERFKLPLCIRE